MADMLLQHCCRLWGKSLQSSGVVPVFKTGPEGVLPLPGITLLREGLCPDTGLLLEPQIQDE